MATVIEQIHSADSVICQNIDSLTDQRALLSQNILSQLRNLVEAVIVYVHTASPATEFDYAIVGPALGFVKSQARLNFLGKFHKLIQKSASHYTLEGDASERLMLKYYEYLHRVRGLLQVNYGVAVLANLESFPVDLDPSLREYHDKIAGRIASVSQTPLDRRYRHRYYVHKTRPFFVGARIYYEVTFYSAVNRVTKFDRIIGFTDIDLTDKYAAHLTLQQDSIEVIGHTMPIVIIRDWEVSIRPCEFDNFARLLGIFIDTRTNSSEYRYLMHILTSSSGSLLDLIDLPSDAYAALRAAGTAGVVKPLLFPVLDQVRRIVLPSAPGHNVLRYLMLRMHNQILKAQFSAQGCSLLSHLKLPYGCIPFDSMPYCSSLPDHNPRYWDLVECIDASGRNHELLARRVRNNVEHHGVLYTPVSEVEEFGDVNGLIAIYNSILYHKHTERRMALDRGHVFICGYENETVAIVAKLQQYASSGVAGYAQAVQRWIAASPRTIDDHVKESALHRLFSHSRVALIYGAAGTGKSTMVDHIAHYFNDKSKLFLAHTNPALDNLKRKVTAQNSFFRTITSHISRKAVDPEFDLLIIDECSTVSNSDLLKVLNKTVFRLLVLVGDVFQIESIQFGNWFTILPSFIPATSVFELTTPFRTRNEALLGFWNKVRAIEDDIVECMARHGYSSVLDNRLFERRVADEIILCLNYDGLYGINNINRFLQSSNPNPAFTWGVSTYKIDDPVLFHETERFRPVIYNNLKGRIAAIARVPGRIQFDVELGRPLSEFDVSSNELEWVSNSTVRFSVYEYDSSDQDDDSLNTFVPFQVAYAVSIHKAQGLEYDSVKIVITDANEEDISHSIFYTAVTRAREHLQIFWTPETQQGVLRHLKRITNQRDIAILRSRRASPPVP